MTLVNKSFKSAIMALINPEADFGKILVFLPIIVILLLNHLRWAAMFPHADLAYFSDDLFYYLTIARNILREGSSTFDGVTLTNGYHPLWMVIILSLGKCCGGMGDVFFICFRILLGLLCVISGVFLSRLCCLVIRGRVLGLAVFVYFYYMVIRLTLTGMEVALSIPLLLAFVLSLLRHGEAQRFRDMAMQAMLGAMLILSRLDSMIFVIPALMTVLFLDGSVKRKLGLLGLGLGIIGVVIGPYFAWNQSEFGSWMPLSGVAKGLKTSLMPSLLVVSSILRLQRAHEFFMVFLPFVMVLLGNCFWLSRGAPWRGRQRWVAGWVLCFPIVYYLILMMRSDWPLWSWYYYPLPVAGIIAARILSDGWVWPIETGWRRLLAWCLMLLSIVYVGGSVGRVFALTPYCNPCYRTALGVEAFANNHPGVYAMGDQAGLASFITGLCVVQVEGLVCDLAMIEHIRKKANLRDVLTTYGVDYYVTVQALKQRGGCREVQEPSQAGDLSAKMVGVFCESPAFQVHFPDSVTLSIFRLTGH